MASLAEATTLTASQVAFFADDSLVAIIPSESLPELNLLSGTVGPFIPGDEVEVPLWLAVRMRKSNQCVIVPPKWLTVEHLERVANAQGRQLSDYEKEQTQQLPYHWREIAQRLFEVAADDLKQASGVRNQMDILWAKRLNAMRNNLINVAGSTQFLWANLTDLHVGSMELNSVRPFWVEAVSQLYSLYALSSDRTSSSMSQSQSDSSSATQSYGSRARDSNGQPMTKQPRYDSQYSQ